MTQILHLGLKVLVQKSQHSVMTKLNYYLRT